MYPNLIKFTISLAVDEGDEVTDHSAAYDHSRYNTSLKWMKGAVECMGYLGYRKIGLG